VGDIDNIQRHARMDRYVAQVTFSPNVSPHSVLDVHTQFDKSGSVSSPLSPLPPYNLKNFNLPSPLSIRVALSPPPSSSSLPPYN